MTPIPSRTQTADAVVQVCAYLVALAVVLPAEISRMWTMLAGGDGLNGYLSEVDLDTAVFALLLFAAPVCWMIRRAPIDSAGRKRAFFREWFGRETTPTSHSQGWSGVRAWTLACVVGLASLLASLRVASFEVGKTDSKPLGTLPPAYHDEYSYLFQAKTFLAGRVWFPSHPTASRIFDQMHVLNEGRFASRYFPGAGAWIAPFLAAGNPYWGHWLAGALSAMFVFWAGRELGGSGVGFLAGLLTAVAPGMAIFSNLLLAHHPTLVGLTLFLFQFLRMMRTGDWKNALLAGVGLSFAMLSRPMTAAGFGLPFGVWLLWWLLRKDRGQWEHARSSRISVPVAIGAPLVVGFALLFAYNRAVTGSGWTTPYQVFTDIYTPRHVYGFNNVVRGERKLGPKVLDNYDRWAENLTPKLAVQNVQSRMTASLQWTLAVVPLAMAAVIFVLLVGAGDRRWWLIGTAIVTLHAVHVPYWYDGIMHYHYVFETGPLWLLIFSGATQLLSENWRRSKRPWMPLWWSCIVLVAVATNWIALPGLGSGSRLQQELQNLAFARTKYQRFHELISRRVNRRPALVMIFPDPDDRHIDYVVNDPGLKSDVLFGRFRPGETDLEDTLFEFPDRTWYVFDARTGQLDRVSERE